MLNGVTLVHFLLQLGESGILFLRLQEAFQIVGLALDSIIDQIVKILTEDEPHAGPEDELCPERKSPGTTTSGVRRWKASSCLTVRTNHVADTAHGVDQFLAARRIDLISEQVHKSVESIFFDIAIESPHGLDQ